MNIAKDSLLATLAISLGDILLVERTYVTGSNCTCHRDLSEKDDDTWYMKQTGTLAHGSSEKHGT